MGGLSRLALAAVVGDARICRSGGAMKLLASLASAFRHQATMDPSVLG